MAKPGALIPSSVHTVDFYGDSIRGLIVTTDAQPMVYVPLRPLCDYLGLDWSAQYRRLHRDPVLRDVIQGVAVMATGSSNDQQDMVCLPLEFLPGWLFTINAARVKPELQAKITQYRRECFTVLWRAFQADSLSIAGPTQARPDVPSTALAVTSTTALLTQLRDQALGQAALAEQQLALELRVSTHDDRFKQAGLVIRDMQRRLGALEERIQPTQLITEAEAAEVATQVKALAETLTSHNPGKNHYQSIFGELNRRFQVASYRRLSRAQLADVMQFLDDWRTRAQPDG